MRRAFKTSARSTACMVGLPLSPHASQHRLILIVAAPDHNRGVTGESTPDEHLLGDWARKLSSRGYIAHTNALLPHQQAKLVAAE